MLPVLLEQLQSFHRFSLSEATNGDETRKLLLAWPGLPVFPIGFFKTFKG